MRLAHLVLVPIASIACSMGGCSKGATPSADVTGTLSVDGKPVTVLECRPGQAVHPFVELITSSGVLRFEDKQLYWNSDRQATSRGAKLTCPKLDRSWGGGSRDDGTRYWRGILMFTCDAPLAVSGDLQMECGYIGPQDRKELDRMRDEMREEQRKAAGSGSAGSAGSGS
jgi:hypothetical protein